jgi:hypothetical protein
MSVYSSRHVFLRTQYLFDEGRIVELNNQAKHSVVNNMTDTHRVHLIFDYVDDHPIKQRFQLAPGEVIYQTRRSVDLAREAALPDARRKAPTFVIIGAQVRSIFDYLRGAQICWFSHRCLLWGFLHFGCAISLF